MDWHVEPFNTSASLEDVKARAEKEFANAKEIVRLGSAGAREFSTAHFNRFPKEVSESELARMIRDMTSIVNDNAAHIVSKGRAWTVEQNDFGQKLLVVPALISQTGHYPWCQVMTDESGEIIAREGHIENREIKWIPV